MLIEEVEDLHVRIGMCAPGWDSFRYCLAEFEVIGAVADPMLSVATWERTGEVDGLEPRSVTYNKLSKAITINAAISFAPGGLQCSKLKALSIKTVRKSRRVTVAGIIGSCHSPERDDLFHNIWINERTVAGEAQHDVRFMLQCSLIETVQHIVFAAAKIRYAVCEAVIGDHVVGRERCGGQDNMINRRDSPQCINGPAQQWRPAKPLHHLAGQPGRSHARQTDSDGSHGNPAC